MFSTRQNKVGRLVQKELGTYFRRESRTLFRGKMITVTVVRVTGDLGIARVYLSIFPVGKDEDALQIVEEHHGRIRNELGKKVRHQLRTIPELQFFIDDSLDYVRYIEELLKK